MNFRIKFRSFIAFLLLSALLLGLFPTTLISAQDSAPALEGQGEEVGTLRAESPEGTALQTRVLNLIKQIEVLAPPTGATKHGNILLDLTGYSLSKPLAGLDRNYYLAVNVDGQTYVFDGSNLSNGKVKARPVAVEGNSLVGVKEGYTVAYYFFKVDSFNRAYYWIGFNANNFIHHGTDNRDILASNRGNYLKMCCEDGSTAFLRSEHMDTGDPTKYNMDVIGLSADKTTFEFHEYANTPYNRLYLYRFVWSVEPLYNAIRSMQSYLQTFLTKPDSYKESTFSDFLTAMEESLTLYNRYYAQPSEEDLAVSENISEILRDQTNSLLGYDTLFDTSLEYIDIPVEILDFRSDGILMHPTGYHLVQNERSGKRYDDKGNQVFLPGRLLHPDMDPSLIRNARLGLTLPQLDDSGYPVYHPDTVQFVAAGLLRGNLHYNMSNQSKGYHNNVFIEIIESKKIPVASYDAQGNKSYTQVDFTYGSFEDTLAKTSTGENGGDLSWDSVRTCFDMAYYILHYLWRPVPEEEQHLFHDGYLYNIPVPERNTLRMYRGADGFYTLNSGKAMAYSGSYIYNSESATAPAEHPFFQPIDTLGFEKGDYHDTDIGSGLSCGYSSMYTWQNNFSMSMRARGSFVYYEDQDLYFTFTGDDDVMFFVNNRIAVDLGGNHAAVTDSLYLNDKKEELGLVDGQVYSCDMFYAERGAYATNLTFRTNIKILDSDAVTTKGQYLVKSGGKVVADPHTTMGAYLDDNSIVNKGDTIAYSFELLNKRDLPLYNVCFTDGSLGVTVSPDQIRLSDPGVSTNGVVTELSDLLVLYRSYDGEAVNGQSPVIVGDYTAFLEEILEPSLIGQAGTGGVTQYEPFPTGSYLLKGLSEGQLRELLALGVPPRAQLMIYGFKRNTAEGDTPYVNTLRSTCYYAPPLSNPIEVNGSAGISVRVMNQKITDLPSADAERVVLDYGKTVLIPLDELRNHIYTNRDVSVMGLVGFLTQSSHGTFLKNLPQNLILVKENDTYHGIFGTFGREKNYLTYSPNQFLTDTDTVYAVFELDNCYAVDPEDPDKSYRYSYICVEVTVQPATITYYETDFAEGIFDLSAKEKGQSAPDAWTTAEETPIYERIHKEDVPDNAFFVDFDGTGYYDRYRDNPIYGGMDLDNLAYWVSFTEREDDLTAKDHPTLDQEAGTISIAIRKILQEDGTYVPGKGAIYVQPGRDIVTHYDLRIKPDRNMFLQMRFKLENFNPPDGKAVLDFGYYTGNGKYIEMKSASDEINSNYLSSPLVLTQEHVSGEFVTVRIPLTDPEFAQERYITSIRPSFKNLTSISLEKLGKLTIDYIYLGPEIRDHQDFDRVGDTYYSMKPDRELIPENAFFVDFDGEGYADRYSKQPQYRNQNFDTESWGYNTNKIESIVYDTTQKGAMIVSIKDTVRDYVFVDTIFKTYTGTPGGITGLPLSYTPSDTSFAEVRLKFDYQGAAPETLSKLPTVFMTYMVTPECASIPIERALTTEHSLFSDATIGRGFGSDRPVNQIGEYVTMRFNLCDQFYDEESVSGFRLWFNNLAATYTVTVDYVYVGPAYAPAEGTNAPDYLYFGFDADASDALRYDTALYGNRNFDNPDAWNTGNTFTLTEAGGILQTKTTETLANSKDGWCGIVAESLQYHPGEEDYLQIRFRIDDITQCFPRDDGSSDKGRLSLYYEGTYKDGYTAPAGTKHTVDQDFVLAQVNGKGWLTWTIPLKTQTRGLPLSAFAEISEICISLSWMKMVKDATNFRIDYVYVGPYSHLPQEDTGAVPLTEDALFFDFTNTDVDRVRYSSPIYGGHNFDLLESWYHTNVSQVELRNGEMILTDARINQNNNHNALKTGSSETDGPLHYIPGENDYCIARVKLINAIHKPNSKDGVVGFTNNGRLEFSLYCYYEGEKPHDYPWVDMGSTFIDPREADGDYMTLCFPLTSPYYTKAEYITAIQPQFHICDSESLEKPAVFTIDYLYVGPLSSALAEPSVSSLYFNFDDTAGDRSRYDNDSYGYIQLDTQGTWGFNAGRDKSVTTDNAKGVITIDTTGIIIKKDEDGNIISNTEDGFSWIQTGLMGERVNGKPNTLPTLDFHPDRAEIAQIRFRIEGPRQGVSDGLVYLQYFFDGDRPSALTTAGSTTVDGQKLSGGQWVTATIPLNDGFRNCNTITGICPGFHGLYWAKEDEPIKIVIDYIYVGPGEIPPVVYGYDKHYTDDPGYSDYDSLFTVGKGINLQTFNPEVAPADSYTQAEFTFTGTGFDLISRTGITQGAIRVAVFDQKGNTKKALTVNNKGELELYQIPVVSVQGLDYGSYRVVIGVNEAVDSIYDILDRGGDFYFDGVRIYDPMSVSAQDKQQELSAYRRDKEAYEHIKEIRNLLLTATEFTSLVESAEGAVFIDAAEDDGSTDSHGKAEGYLTADVQTYNKIGPKNEVYLAPGQAVAFKIQISTTRTPVSIDVGVKTIRKGESADFVGGIVTQLPDANNSLRLASRRAERLYSATAQYYDLGINSNSFFTEGGKRYCYIVLYNSGSGGKNSNVLSVTDLKIAYDIKPEAGLPQDGIGDTEIWMTDKKTLDEPYFAFLVDDRTLEAAELVIRCAQGLATVDPSVQIKHSLNLSSDISINYVVPGACLGSFENLRMECILPIYENNLQVGERTVLLRPVAKGDSYYFTLDGLTAIQFCDVISARVLFTDGVQDYASEWDVYSICTYAYNQLNKGSASSALKTLCADLLRYGSAAQSFKGYRTDTPADGAMSMEHKAYLSDLTTLTFADHNELLGDMEKPVITWAGKSLSLESKVVLKYVINTESYDGDLERLNLRVSYKNLLGETVHLILSDLEEYHPARQQYAFCLDSLPASELRAVISAQVYIGDQPASVTLRYSPDTYGNNKTGALGELCKALFAYSDSAKAYFLG